MKRKSGQGNRLGCVVQALKFVIAPAVLIYLFWSDIELIRQLITFVTQEDKTVTLPPQQEWSYQLLFFLTGISVALMVAILLLYYISGKIYPLNTGWNRLDMFTRLVNFFFGSRRPVIWVQEGKLKRKLTKEEKIAGGVAFVDPQSAIVLEAAQKKEIREEAPDKRNFRVCSGGVTFISSKEKYLGAVSLRKQSRTISNVKVQTSDGIELTTNLTVNFTLGEQPEVLKVAYVSDDYVAKSMSAAGSVGGAGEIMALDTSLRNSIEDQKYLNLRIVKMKWGERGGANIEEIVDGLDLEDKIEIHAYARKYKTKLRPRSESLAQDDEKRSYPPYWIDEKRIEDAVSAIAQRADRLETEEWAANPAYVALEKLRNIIGSVKFDELYLSREFDVFGTVGRNPGIFPLVDTIRPLFNNSVKNMGVLSYQYIFPITGHDLEVTLRVDPKTFRIAPVQTLSTPKRLRQLGIKVISAEFGDLEPSLEMKKQRFEHWRLRWQEITDHQRALRFTKAEQIKNKARAQRYYEMINSMLAILTDPTKGISGDVAIQMIVQTLTDMAADPDTRKGLPEETMLLMQKIQSGLFATKK